jgi:hypothetical protein
MLNQGNRDSQPAEKLGNARNFFASFVGQSPVRIFFCRLRFSVLNQVRVHIPSSVIMNRFGVIQNTRE